MRRLLIVCTGNTCRSPMAEGIVRDLARQRGLPIEVSSAGIAAMPGDAVSPNAVEALGEIGIDISAHRSSPLRLDTLTSADEIYVMSPSHRAAILDGVRPYCTPSEGEKIAGRITVLNVPDPFGGDLEAYRCCRDVLRAYFEKRLGEEDA